MKIPVSQGISAGTLQQVGKSITSGQQSSQAALSAISAIGQHRQQVNKEQQAQEFQKSQLDIDAVLSKDFSDYTVNLKNDVSNGVKTADQADQELLTWSGERYKALEESQPEHAREKLKQYWDVSVNRQRGGFLPLQIKANQQRSVQLTDQAFNMYSQLSISDQEAEAKFNIFLGNTTLSEVQKTEAMYDLKVNRQENSLNQTISTLYDAGDLSGLQKLDSELEQGKYIYQNGDRIQHKRNAIASRIGSLEQRQITMEKQRVNEAGKVLNDFIGNVLTGRPLDAQYTNDVAQGVQGTEYQAEFDFYQKHSENFQKFSRLPTTQQKQYLDQATAEAKNSPTGNAKTESKVLGVYQRIYNEKMQQVRNDPVQVLRENGTPLPQVTAMQVSTDPKGFIKGVVDIGSKLIAQEDGNISMRPISPDVLPDAKANFAKLSANQKIDFVSDLLSQTKGMKGSSVIWGGVLGQLTDGDLSYVQAGLARMNGYKSSGGQDIASAIILGKEAMKNKQFVMPKDDELAQAFNQYVGQSVGGQDANMLFGAFEAIYANQLVRRNINPKDKDEAFNQEAIDSALSMATGGIYQQEGSFRDYQGEKYDTWQVSKPYGMSDERFESSLDGGYRALVKHTNLSVEELKDFRLKRSGVNEKGEIAYQLLYDSGAPLRFKNGNPAQIIIGGATR